MGSKKKTKKVPQTHRKNKKGSAVAAFLSLTLMCLSVLLALSLTVFFKTKSITVKGETIYSNEQIVAASGITVGKNMFISMFAGASNNIERFLPYVGEATINRNLDGNVVITVKPAVAARCYEFNNEFLLTDAQGKVLEKVAVAQMDKPLISGIELKKYTPGEKIEYSNDSSTQLLAEIFASAEDNSLEITAIKTDADRSFVDVIIENKYLVHLLNGSDIDYKFLHIKKSLESKSDETGGTFSFSTVEEGKAIFTPGDIFGEPTEEPDESLNNGDETPDTEGEVSSQPEENDGE